MGRFFLEQMLTVALDLGKFHAICNTAEFGIDYFKIEKGWFNTDCVQLVLDITANHRICKKLSIFW